MKHRLSVTWIAEYWADDDHYPDCDGDPAKMAASDQDSVSCGDIDLAELMMDTQTVTIEPA